MGTSGGSSSLCGGFNKKKLNNMAVFTIGDLANCHSEFLVRQLGKWGYTLWSFANGYDTSPVAKNDCEIPIKSIGNSLPHQGTLRTTKMSGF